MSLVKYNEEIDKWESRDEKGIYGLMKGQNYKYKVKTYKYVYL